MTSETAERAESLLTGQTGRLFVLLTMGATVIKAVKFVLPPLLPEIILDLDITAFQAGVALSTMNLCVAAFQFPGGRLSDRLSRTTVLVVGVGVVLVGCALLRATTGYLVLLAGMALAGTGDGLYAPAARAQLSDLFVRRRGQAFGGHMTAIDLGGLLGSGLAILVVASATWHEAFLPAIVALTVVLVLLYRWRVGPLVFDVVPLGVRETGTRLFGEADVRWLLVAYSLFVFTVQGVFGFLPALLRTDRGFAPADATLAFALLFGVGVVVKPLAGRTSDSVPRPVVAVAALAIGTAGISLLVVAPSAGIAVAAVALFAVGQKSFGPVMQAHLMDTFPDGSMGGDLGATRAVYLGVGSLGPAYVGYVAGVADYSLAFAGLAACLLVGAAVLTWLTFVREDGRR